jgi:hypothetical protein
MAEPLEHDPEKWKPVFGKDHAQTRDGGVHAMALARRQGRSGALAHGGQCPFPKFVIHLSTL